MEEVLPCSDTQRAAESDRSQPNLGTSYLCQEEPINCVENREDDMFQYDNQLNNSLLKKIEGQGPTVSEILANSYCQNAGALVFDSQVENQEKPCSLHAIEDNDINEPRLTSENSLSMVDLIENELSNTGREGALSFSEPAWLKGEEETMAVWVKWRGTWLAGIKCVRADCPLSILKVKPTDKQKNYFVIFFPHTKNHSWANMLLVRPIDDFPQPTAYKTHQEGLEMVKDLTVARRLVMQDLALSILNTLDQLHSQALEETACDVMVWKELAMEASRCNAYSDLGRMLLKLRNSIAPRYISAEWVKSSFDSWAERCWNLNSAESVDLLKEELFNSILWNDINRLWGLPVQETLGSKWKTWKQDVMKWFSTPDSAYQVSLQIGSKRHILQVRRVDTHTSLVGIKGSDQSITLETNPGFSKNQNTVSALAIMTSVPENFREAHVETDLPSNLTNQRNEVVVEGTDSEILNSNGMELIPIDDMAGEKIMEPGTKNKQCIAYVEAKGRLCVRPPNDGDKYCCVHSRCLSSPGITKKCVGITIAGTRCQHHPLPDSPFCKKHRPSAETNRKLKRKHDGNCTPSEGLICKDMVLLNDEVPLQVIPMLANHGDCFLHKFPGKLVLSGNSHNAMEEAPRCLGSPPYDNEDPCLQSPLWYFLYCEKHLPSWLKRRRYGKTRVISKEVFTEILRDCSSWEQKVHLHKACAFFYTLFKGILRNPVLKEVQFQCTVTEATKDPCVAELLKRLIISEKDRIKLIWGFDDDVDISSLMEGPSLVPTAINGRHDIGEFPDDPTQGNHWMENHNKEAPWLCSSYGCAICRVSFPEKKLLENHVQEQHQGAKLSDHSVTLETNPGFSKNQDTVSALEIVTLELENLIEVPVETDLPSKNQQWNSNEMESTSIEAGTKNQQCVAYDEVKGRQSVRSALRSARKAKKPVPIETLICGGTTNAGNRCKLKGKHEASCTGSEGLICNDTGILQVDPVLAIHGGCFLDKLPWNLALSDNDHNATGEVLRCLGSPPYDNEEPCLESPLWYSLYCEKHFPNWLKHSSIGKRRIISKEVFTDILRDCSSWEQKVHLHKACAFFYTLFKGILRNPVLKEVQLQCTMTEATKDPSVAELFKRLIISEKDRIKLIWGFNDDIDMSSLMEGPWLLSTVINDCFDNENGNKCKICNAEFTDDRILGNHWMEYHEKEAQGLFRGLSCAICLDSFTEKKLLENHVQGRHRMQFVEKCLLLQCITCGSPFGNMEQLWFHVLSVHPVEFKLQLVAPEQETLTLPPCEASLERLELGNSASLDNDSQDPGSLMKFSCNFCELKFNLLPDLGRHHQTAHMGCNQISSKLAKRRALSSAHRLKSDRLRRLKFKKGSSTASYQTRNRANANLKRRIQETKSLRMKGKNVHLNSGSLQNGIVLCDDISFGKESIPVICVEDQETLNSQFQPPWESFTYVTKPRLHQSLSLHSESMQMQSYFSFFTFCPETFDHVYLFDNEFDDAKDVLGKPMRGRGPYDENGRMILEEGYLVYECNNMSRCNKTCPNRILQNGIRVKLEVFKTVKKGWGVRAGEAILRGTFICELLGEVLDEREAHDRRKRYGKEHNSYFYDIDARFNDTSKMSEGQGKYVIDATRYGNVSRFINSSCSPNLVSYRVFVESMDCKRSHIGLYASRDIALGEELTFDYHQYKLVAGEGTPCLCGSSNCRGRVY